MGSVWEKVTHLTLMLGGGPYLTGSDSALENMVPLGDITVQDLASLKAFLSLTSTFFVLAHHQNYKNINQDYLV